MSKVDDEGAVVLTAFFTVQEKNPADGLEGRLLRIDGREERLEDGCGEGFEMFGYF